MNLFFRQAPFVRMAIAQITGVLCAVYCTPYIHAVQYTTAFLLSLALFLFFYRRKRYAPLLAATRSIVCLWLIACLGYLLTWHSSLCNAPGHFSSLPESRYYVVVLEEDPVPAARSYKVKVRVEAAVNEDSFFTCQGRMQLYIARDSSAAQLVYGDRLAIAARVNEVSPPQNPGAFDYRNYLSQQNIYHQGFVKQNGWLLLAREQGAAAMQVSQRWRRYFLEVLERRVPDPEAAGVAKALIVGYTHDLSDEVLAAYSGTGTMHVLAVSGMHVAIVFVVFSFLLQPLQRSRGGRIVRILLLLLLLWAYAFVTGLSASVLRSAAMFSFVVLGRAFHRHTSIYNSLAASCFVLLCYQPFMLFQVGFQLSYLAVLGIVFYAPYIHNWWLPRHRWTDYVWELLAVSVAAQLVTFPLSLFYFHQFPNLFFLSNLLVIPLSTPTLYLGCALLAVAEIPYLSAGIGWLVNWLILFSNGIVKAIEGIPYALSTGIYISGSQTALIYLLIALIPACFIRKRYLYLLLLCSTTVVLAASFVYDGWQARTRRLVVVYQVPGASAVGFIARHSVHLAADSLLTPERFAFHIRPHWEQLQVPETPGPSPVAQPIAGLYWFYGKKIAVLREMRPFAQHTTALPVDVLVLSRDCDVSLHSLAENFKFRNIVLDSSCTYKQVNRWKKEAAQLRVVLYNVQEQGAFVMHL